MARAKKNVNLLLTLTPGEVFVLASIDRGDVPEPVIHVKVEVSAETASYYAETEFASPAFQKITAAAKIAMKVPA